MDPNTLVPLGGLLGAKTQVALVGDPKQLGPVVRSGRGLRHGLAISLLKKLATLPLYSRPFNPAFITMLVNNFR